MSTHAKQPPPPSPHARKLLQKLAAVHPAASSETLATLAGWIVFNRKKAAGTGEGLVVAVHEASRGGGSGSSSGSAAEKAARLMLLLRILHRVLLLNSPAGPDGDPAGKWDKASALRLHLGEAVVPPLWTALAPALAALDDDALRERYEEEVRGMLEEWGEHDALGGPTVVEEYKRGWHRARREAEGGGGEADAAVGETIEGPQEAAAGTAPGESSDAKGTGPSSGAGNDEEKPIDAKGAEDMPAPSPPAAAGAEGTTNDGPPAAPPLTKRDSAGSAAAPAEIEIDYEGVGAARVEPSHFLDACKVIASIQIARDIGSDAAMNLSSALANVPSEVEEACNKVLEGEAATVTDVLSDPDALANVPDEVLDLDLSRARRSLQAYRDSIRKQRQARLRCLRLLLASRCDFGALEAARAYCGGGGGTEGGEGAEGTDDGNDGGGKNIDMDMVLSRLGKRKEALVDAMALEGLDVEEEEDDGGKTPGHKGEGTEPTIPDWFPGREGATGDEEGPAAKKLKRS